MKKIIALLLAVLMIMSLVACGDSTTPEKKQNEPTETTTPSTPDSSDTKGPTTNAERYPLDTDTVLRVLISEDGLGDTDASALWTEVTGVEIENLTWNNEQMMTSLASNDIPDAIIMPWTFPKDTVYEYGRAGKFLDFSQYLDKMPNVSAVFEKYPEAIDICTYPDGAVYSLPQVNWNTAYQSNVIYLNVNMMHELGWENAPTTTDEFIQLLKEAQDKYGATDPDFVAFHPYNKTYMRWNVTNSVSAAFFPSFGDLIETGLTLDQDNKVTLGAATEQYKHYLEFMHEIWTSGTFETEVYTLETAAGKAAIQEGHCIASIGTYAPEADSDGSIIVMAPLTSEYQSTQQWQRVSTVRYRGCVASASCSDLDTLLAYIDSFYAPLEDPLDDEGTVYGKCFSNGRLGTHWTIDEATQTWTKIEGTTFTNYYDQLYGGEFLYTPAGSLHVKGEGVLKNCLPYAVQVSGLDSLTLEEDAQDEYVDIWTDMESYISEMHGKFISGEEDIASGWDSYMKNLEKMGLNNLLTIYQNAYDAK